MGRESPAQLGRHRQRQLVALTVTLLLTCGPGPDECVAITTRELSQGEHGSTTWPTSNPSSLTTMINVGMSTRSPEMATAFKIISSKQPSTSPEMKYTLGNSWNTSTATVPMKTTAEPVTLQSTAIESGSISLPHLPTGFMTPAKSPAKGTATTEWVSLSPSEVWTNSHLGTPEGTKKSLGTVSSVSQESNPKGNIGTGPQRSPTPIPRTTGMNLSVWLGSTGGTTVDTHVSLNTSSIGPEDSVTIPDSVTTQMVTMSSVTDKSEFITKTRVNITVTPSTVLSKDTMTDEQQASISVSEAYSSASPWSEQTTGSNLIIGKSPEAKDTLHNTSLEQTTLASLTSESQDITSITNATGGKMSSSPSVTFPSVGSKTLATITSVVTSDVASTLGQLSQTSYPAAGVSNMEVTIASTPLVTTTITTMETNSVLTTMPDPKASVSSMDSTLATETSTSALQHPPTRSSTAATPGPRTITDMASILEVTGSPKANSAMSTTSSIASSTESGSVSTPHGLVTVIGTSLAIPSSFASAEKTEASTSVRTLSPLDTTASMPISTSGVERMSTSVPDILSTSQTPSRRETEALHVSMTSMDHPNTKTIPKSLPSTPQPDSLSTLNWATGSSVSSAITSTSVLQEVTTPSELPLENMISPTTSQLPSSIEDITSEVTPVTMVNSSKVTLSGRPDLASKEVEQSSTQLHITASADPGYMSRPEATTLDLIPYTVRTPYPTPRVNGIRTPTTQARATPHSWMGEEESSSRTSLNTEVINVSSVSGGTIKEVTDSPGLLKTTDLLGISLESGTTSSPNWKNGTYERIATSEPTIDKETIHPSTNTVDTTVWPSNSEHDLHSTVPAHSESSMGTYPMNTTSIMLNTIVSTTTTTWPESTRAGRELDYPLTTELRESSIYMDTNSTAEISSVHSLSSFAITRVSGTEVTTSDRISSPDLAQSTRSSDITRPSTFPDITDSEKMTITMQTGPSGTTSLGAPTMDTLVTASLSGTYLAVTQGFPQSKITTQVSKGPEGVSWTNLPSVGEATSSSSLAPISDTTSSSHVLLTSQGQSTSSTLPVTSGLLPKNFGLGKTRDMLRTSLETDTSLPPNLRSSSDEMFVTTDIEATHPSTNTAMTHVETTSYGHESHSPVLAHTQPSKATSSVVTSSTMWDTTAPTLMSGSSETIKIERESVSSLNTRLRETSTYQETGYATETSTVISNVSTNDATTEATRKQVTSSNRISIPSPIHFKTSPNTPTESRTSPSISMFMSESSGMTITTQTGPPGAISQDTLTLDISTKVSGAGNHSTMTQSFMHSEMTTLRSRGPEDVSWPSPASVTETGSPSSPGNVPAMTAPSPEPSTLPGRSPSSPTPVTSLLARSLGKTKDTLATSVEPVSSSTSSEISTTIEILSTSEASTGTDAIEPSKNTAGTHRAKRSSGHETHSSAPADSEPSNVTSPIITPSTSRDTRVSTSMPHSLGTTMFEIHSTSSLTPELRKTSTVQQNSSAIEKITLLSKVPTDTTTEISRIEPISSSSTSISGPVQSAMSPDIPAGIITRPSASPVMTESAEVTVTPQTGPTEATSQHPLHLGTTTNTSGAEIHSTVTQSFTQSEMTTLRSRGPEDVSWPSPASVTETGSPSSPGNVPAMTAPSPEPSTLPGRSPSSPTPVTSLLTRSLGKTKDTLATSVEPVSSSPSSEISTTTEILSSYESSTGTDAIQPSKNTAGTHRANTSFGHEAHSSAPADSEPSNVTSPIITPSTPTHTSVSTSMPHSLETTMFEIHSTSSLTPELRKTSTVQQNSSATAKIAILSKVQTDTTTEISRTEPISSSSTSIPGHVQLTMSPDIPAGIITRPSVSPVTTESEEVNVIPQTGPTEATSQDPLTLASTTNISRAEIHSTVTQSFTHSEMTTLRSRGPEDVSWPSPVSVIETGSLSSPVIVPAMTAPSPQPSTLPGRKPTSSTPVTSLLTRGLGKTKDTLATSVEPVSSSASSEISTTIEIPSTSEASTGIDAIEPSKNTAGTHRAKRSSGHETHSSAPADSEPSNVTSPIITPSTSRDTRVSTSMPHSLGTTMFEIHSTSSLTPELRKTSTVQQNSSAIEKITLLSKVPTDTTTEISRIQPISSSSTSISGPVQSAMSPDIPAGIITRPSASPVMTESAEVTVTPQTGPTEATSQHPLHLGTTTNTSGAEIHSTVTQSFTQSEMTTLRSRGPEDVSWPSPASVTETGSPSSPGNVPAMTAPSPEPSTLPGRSPSSPTPVTSLLTRSLGKTKDTLATSVEPVSSSPTSEISTTTEILSSYESSTGTDAIQPSKNTAGTHRANTSFGHETHSSAPADSEPSNVTSPMVIPSTPAHTSVSTSMPHSLETTMVEIHSTSSLTPELRKTSTVQQNSSAIEKITLLSKVPTDTTTEISRTEPISSSSTSTSGPVQSAMSPDIPAGIITRPSDSPITTESAEVTVTPQTGPTEATSQLPLHLGTTTNTSGADIHSTVTQSFTQSEMTTLRSRGPEDVSWPSPVSVTETGSPSSPGNVPAMTAPSPEPSTLPGRSPSSPTPVTSLLTRSLGKTKDTLATSVEPVSSSPSSEISTTTEILSSYESSTGTDAIQPSKNTAGTHRANTSFGHEAHSSAPADSEPSNVTSPIITPSTPTHTSVSTSMPHSLETTMFEIHSTSSLTPELRKTSTVQQNSSATAKIAILSKVQTDTTTEISRTEPISSSSTSIPGHVQLTMSPDIPAGIITRPSVSPVTTESEEVNVIPQTGPTEATSQDPLTLASTTNISRAEIHSTVTQSFTHSEMTTLRSRGPEDVSWPSPVSVIETGSLSSPVIVPAMTAPSPQPSTLPGRKPTSSTPVTSLLTRGLGKTKDTLATSVEPVSSSASSEISTTIEIPSTSEASTGIDAIEPSKNTAGTHRAKRSSGHETHSSAPADSEPSNVTSPIITPSTSRDTRVSTSMPHSLGTTMFEIHSTSSLTPELRKTSTVQQNSSAIEKITLLSKVPTDTTTEISRIQPISSSSTSISGPVQSAMSPDIPAGIITRPSASPVMTESAEVTVTPQTGPTEATSQHPLHLGTTTNTSGAEIHSTVTQSFTQSEMTTLRSRGPEDVSWPSPASVTETGSPSSPGNVPAMTAPSPEPSTLPGRSPSSPTPVTSLLTRSLGKTKDTLATSVEPVSSSPTSEISTTTEILSSYESSTGTDAIQPSKNTAGTHRANTSFGHETHSSAPADSEPSNVTSPMVIPSTPAHTSVSTSMPHSLETTMVEIHSTSSLTPELRKTSTVQQNSSAIEKITLLSKVPTDTTTEISRTEPISSSSTSTSGPVQSAMSPDIPAGIITRPSDSPITTESAEVTVTPQTGPTEATSQLPLHLGTTTNTSGADIHSTVTQSFTQSEMTTLRSRGPEDVSWPSPVSVTETGSPSSPGNVPAMTAPSPEPSTLPGRSPSSPTPVTSLLTHSLGKTKDTLATSVEPVSSSPSSEISTTTEILSSYESSTGTDAIQPSKNTAGTHRANTSFGHEAHSSAPADSEPSNVTSPIITPSTPTHTSVSTSMPHSLETTMFEIHSTSSLTPELRKTSTVQQNSSATAKIAILSKVQTDTTTEISRTEPISSSSTSIPGHVQLTMSPDIPAGIITRPSVSPVTTESEEVNVIPQTGPTEATSQDPLTLASTTNISRAEIHSTVTQSFTHSEMTTLRSRGPEDVSWPSPVSVIETGSLSSPVIVPAMTAPSPQPSTLPGRKPTSSTPVTSLLTRGLGKTKDTLATSVEPVSSSASSEISTTIEIPSTSEASTGIDAIEPSKNTAGTHRAKRSSGHETHSSAPADSEPSNVTSPIITPSTSRDTRVSTSMPHSLGTTMFEIHSTSSLTPELRKTSTVQQNSSAIEKITLLSKVPTDTTTEISRIQPISSSSTSISGPVQSAMSPDIPAGIITRPSASPVMTESAEVTVTPQTGPTEATSQHPLHLGTTTNTSGAEIHSTVTQSFTQSEMTTLRSRGPEDVSWPSPASVTETGSPSSPGNVPAMTAPSPEPSTLPGRSPSSPTPVTSLLTRSLGKTKDTLATSVEPVSSSPTSEISTTTEILSSYESSTGTDAIQPSKNTAGTHRANTSFGHETHSSAPADSEPSNVTSPMVIPSTPTHTSVSTSMPHSLETTMVEIHSTSSLTPELRKTSTVQQNSSATAKIAILSKVPTDTTTEISRTEPISSSSTSTSGPVQSAMSPDIPAGIITRPSDSPVTTESAEVTVTTQTGPTEATSQHPLSLGTTTNTSGADIHSTVTQSFTHSEMTTLRSRGPEDVSWPSPVSVIETGSPTSSVIVPAMTAPSPEPSTLPGRSPASPTPVTSLLTRGLGKTKDTLATSVEPVSSSPSSEISTTTEILSSYESSTGTDAIQPSKNTAGTHRANTSFGHEAHSSAPADSEPSIVTSPIITPSTSSDTCVSTSMPHSLGTTMFEIHSTSSLAPELRKTSTVQQNSSAIEKITLLSKVPTDTTTEISRMDLISSSSTSIPGAVQSTMLPDVPAGIITRPSASPVTTESSEVTVTTGNGPTEATSQDPLTVGIATNTSGAEIHSTVTQSFTHSEMTTLRSRGPKDVSWPSPVSVIETGSLSSPVIVPAMTTPSPEASTLPGRSSSSPNPVTSLLTHGLGKTKDTLVTTLGAVTTLPPTLSSPTVEIISTSEFSIDTEKILPSIYTIMSTVGSSSSGDELSSSVPIFPESSSTTYPMGTASSVYETAFSTTIRSSFEMKTLSHLTPRLKETRVTLDSSSSTLTNTPSSHLFTHGLKGPKTDVTSSVTVSAPDQPLSTQYTDIPVETVTRFYTSPSITGSAGITVPESNLSVPVSENTRYLSTDMLSSAETIFANNTLTPSLSEAMASFATSGVPGAISVSTFSRTESDPGDATMPTTAESLPSSASIPFPSLTFRTTDSSSTPLPHWITSSPATARTVDTNLEAESQSTAALPLVTASTLQTWTQPVRTSLPPIMDTRMTESVGLGTVTSTSQVLPHSTQLTRTDGIVERITKIPNEAAHGDTTVHVPLASTSASLRGLSTGGTERAETTAKVLKTTSTVTSTTRVSTPTSGMLSLLRTSDKTASISTTGMIITTPDVPKMRASFVTRPGDKTSTVVPMTIPSTFNRGPQTTPSLVPSSGAETSTAVPTLTDSMHKPETTASWVTHTETSSAILTMTAYPGKPNTTASLVTHPVDTKLTVPRTTPNVSHSELDTTFSVATSLGAEVSSVVPTRTVSAGVPDIRTSQVTSSETDTTMAIVPLTLSPGEPATTVLMVTHSSEETSTSFPASTIFPHLPEITAAPSIPPGLETNTTLPNQTFSLSPPETSSLFTTTVTKTVRVNLTPTASFGVPAETASLSTHPGTDISATISTSAPSRGLPETTGLLATRPATEANTSTPALTVSPGVLGPFRTPATIVGLYPVPSGSTETSPPTTSAGLPEFPKTVTGDTMTLITSETPTPPKTSHEEGLSTTTVLKTTTVETTHLAATGSGPTVAKTTITFNTLSGSPFAPVTTPGTSTLASVRVTSGTSKNNFFIVLNQLFRNSSIKSYFSDCQVSAFRSEPHSNHTGVDAQCNISPLAQRLDRVAIYEEFLRLTKNGTQLQNFILDRNSVLVDGYSSNRNDVLTENSGKPQRRSSPAWGGNSLILCLTKGNHVPRVLDDDECWPTHAKDFEAQ
ncbi:LOW QUALITY PROTEIN: mucin-16-like [Kogia breviceps]|uniref:LOW QUALITY PROTEIN: mucin-16-like n=1 Tax=Kogia breviceps TaxID=27615 RepID=UPI0034D385BB